MMKRLSIGLFLAATMGLVAIASPSQSLDRPYDSNGDYIGTDHRFWTVVDSDPNGLNCRWSEDNPEMWYSPGATFPNKNIANWPIVRRFDYGTVLTANQTPAGLVFFEDDRGLPWLKVSLGDRDRICLVRANRRYIVPLP